MEIDDLKNAFVEAIDNYLEKAHITTISTENVAIEEILHLYFERLPPFGEGKKKSEFPDAISLIALKDWCEKNSEAIYVISGDNDVKGARALSNNFYLLNDLAEYLEIVTEHEQNELEEFIAEFREKFEKEIKEDVKRVMAEHELYEIDHEISAEFENFQVNNVEILSLRVIDADHKTLILDLKADVVFSADVEHQDYDTAAYDKEDDVYFFVDKANYSFESATIQEGILVYQIDSYPPRDWTDIHIETARLEPDVIDVDVVSIRNQDHY